MEVSPPSSSSADATAEPPPPPKLRLMCSYGGHILPRPHDRVLTYVGGDTRIVSVDRRAATLPALVGHLSKSLRQNPPFTLRYQLPNEDLDSLISLTTQEDLDNMLEEHDRIVRSPSSNGRRIRLFIFPSQNSVVDRQNHLETASNKSEDWIFNRIDGKPATPLSDRGFSESSSVNCLLGLEDDLSKVDSSDNIKGEENQNQKAVDNQELVDCKINTAAAIPNSCVTGTNQGGACSVPQSPIKVETTTSSFESTSSSPSVGLVNLPPIKVRVQDTSQKVALGIVEDQLKQMNLEGNFGNHTPSQQNDAAAQQVQHRVQQQSQSLQFQKIGLGGGGVFDLPSPDSVSSDGSFTNPLSRPARQVVHQDQKLHQIQEPAFILPSHYDPNHPQPQSFIQANTQQYIHPGPVPIASYYPIYPSQQPQQPIVEQSNYPFYIVSAGPAHGYNLPIQQPTYSEVKPASNVAPPPHMGSVQSRNVPPSKSEVYRTSAGVPPQMVQFGSNQGQYVAYGQNHHLSSQSMAPLSNQVYVYHEFADSANGGMYYTPVPPQVAAQYQLAPEPSARVSADHHISHHQV